MLDTDKPNGSLSLVCAELRQALIRVEIERDHCNISAADKKFLGERTRMCSQERSNIVRDDARMAQKPHLSSSFKRGELESRKRAGQILKWDSVIESGTTAPECSFRSGLHRTHLL